MRDVSIGCGFGLHHNHETSIVLVRICVQLHSAHSRKKTSKKPNTSNFVDAEELLTFLLPVAHISVQPNPQPKAKQIYHPFTVPPGTLVSGAASNDPSSPAHYYPTYCNERGGRPRVSGLNVCACGGEVRGYSFGTAGDGVDEGAGTREAISDRSSTAR